MSKEIYQGKLASANFEENTIEFEIQHDFTARAGDYVIVPKADYIESQTRYNEAIEALGDLGRWVLKLEDWRGEDPPIDKVQEILKAHFKVK